MPSYEPDIVVAVYVRLWSYRCYVSYRCYEIQSQPFGYTRHSSITRPLTVSYIQLLRHSVDPFQLFVNLLSKDLNADRLTVQFSVVAFVPDPGGILERMKYSVRGLLSLISAYKKS